MTGWPFRQMRPCDYDDGYDDPPAPPDVELPAKEADVGPAPATPTFDCAKFADEFLACLRLKMDLAKECESPIEVGLGAALVERAKGRFKIVARFVLPGYRYRYDLAVMGEGPTPIVLVECDGAEFHSTEKQLANDKAKDAAAIACGTRVIRVTGKEIHKNPYAWAAFIIGECGK